VDPSSSYSCGVFVGVGGETFAVIYTLTSAVPSFSPGDLQYSLYNSPNSCFQFDIIGLEADGTVYQNLTGLVVEDCLDLCFKGGYGYADMAGTV